MVDITNDLPCDGCGEVTDANGQLILTVSNLPSGASDIIVEVSGVSGFVSTTKSIAVTPAAAVDLEVALSPSYTLTVDCPGDNCYGIIDSIPDGISRCSYIEGESRGECSAAFESGTQVALTASPFEGYRFDGWSGDPDCTDGEITMNADIACTATFTSPTVPMHMLTITKTGNGSGRVSSTPGGIDCGAECNEDAQAYDYNQSVTLTAQADEGSEFIGWSGVGSCGTEDTCTVTMDQAYTVTADFNAFGSATLSGTIGAIYGINVIGMAGKPVNLKGPACPPNGNQCEIIGSTTTGLESPLNGTYAFSGLLPGTYQLEILDINTDVFNFPSPLGGVVITTNGSKNNYDPAGNVNPNSVFGRVFYDGEVVEGMTVQLGYYDIIEPGVPFIVNQETETDLAGLYAFSVDSEIRNRYIRIIPTSVGRKDSDFIITEAQRTVGGGAIISLNFSGPPQGGSILSN
jgi:hypothetical protein